MEKNECSVNVAVRIRPLLENEQVNIIQTIENEPQVLIVQDKKNIFAFDHIFPSDVKQNQVYDATVKPLISKVTSGYNCTVLAYGQTGTGKTYTMGSNPQVYNEDAGLISRLLDDFFQYSDINKDILISASFIEIYNEKVYDLLGTKQSFLNVKGFKIQNMTCVNVRDSAEAYHWLNVGSKMRHTGQTALNNNSSRSHAVFTVYLTSIEGVTSKFHMVDLAGSESVRRTGTEGIAFREGITINKGLLTVGRVINALSNLDKVIPYRDSMLTTILQDSLNIKNYVVLLACISPNIADITETLATLRFAEKTKALKSRPQLEFIADEFEKLHPSCLDKHTIGPTPFKRKASTTFNTSTAKKKIRTNNFKYSSALSSSSPKFSISNSKCMSTLSPNLSVLSAINEPVQPSYSPLVKRCTEALQNSVIQHLDSLMKAHLTIMQTPAVEKENVPKDIPWDQMENKISEIVKKEINQLTNQRPKRSSTEKNQTHLISKRVLNFDDNSPSIKTSETNSYAFKMPAVNTPDSKQTYLSDSNDNSTRTLSEAASPIFQVPAPSSKPVRYSTRLSLLKNVKNNPPYESPVLFRLQRRSMRLSMKMAPPLEIPTPAPRTLIDNLIRQKPMPAPRKSIRNKNQIQAQSIIKTSQLKTKSGTKRKSVRTQHHDYVLQTLNEGTQKELQLLATIGVKTALQIITHRNLNGPFKNFTDFERMNGWRGKAYQRFMIANHLESYMKPK